MYGETNHLLVSKNELAPTGELDWKDRKEQQVINLYLKIGSVCCASENFKAEKIQKNATDHIMFNVH